MSHVTQTKWLNIAPTNESCQWVMSHICVSLTYIHHENHVNESCHTHEMSQYRPYKRVLSPIRMSHVPHMYDPYIYTPWRHDYHVNASCHTREILRVALKSESCRLYEWVMSHMCMGHTCVRRDYRMNASCRHIKYEMISSCQHILKKIRNVARMNECCDQYEWVMSHTCMSHTYVWRDNRVNASCHVYDGCNVAHMNESCPTYEWVIFHIYMSPASPMNVPGCPYERIMSHIWTNHVPHMNESCPTYERIMSHIWTNHVPHMMK